MSSFIVQSLNDSLFPTKVDSNLSFVILHINSFPLFSQLSKTVYTNP